MTDSLWKYLKQLDFTLITEKYRPMRTGVWRVFKGTTKARLNARLNYVRSAGDSGCVFHYKEKLHDELYEWIR